MCSLPFKPFDREHPIPVESFPESFPTVQDPPELQGESSAEGPQRKERNVSSTNRRSGRWRSGIVMIGATLLVLAACGDQGGGVTTLGDGGDVTQPTEVSAAPDTTQVADSQVLTVWVDETQPEAKRDLLRRFEEASGHRLDIQILPVEADYAAALSRWGAGERPDIMTWPANGAWMPRLTPHENLQSLTSEPFLESYVFDDLIAQSVTIDGEVYGAVIDYPFVNGVFYNRGIIDELGLEPPSNFADVLRICETLQSERPDVTPVFMGGGDQWPLQVMPFMMWNDAIVQDPDLIEKVNTNQTTFRDPRFVEGIAKVKELQDAGCLNNDILTAGYVDEITAIMDGRAAMLFQGSWLLGSLLDTYDLDAVNEAVGFAAVSADTNVASWQATGGFVLPKTGDPDREAAAREFLRFATGDGYAEFLEATSTFPLFVGHDAPEGLPTALVEANDALLANSIPQYEQTLRASKGAFETFLQEMVAGQKTAEEVAESLALEFERNARGIGLPGF